MKLVCLAGGVGGSRMADGFCRELGSNLTVVVNTADDFRCHGLYVSPDVDTMLYTLSGQADPQQGWGIAGDTFAAMEQLERLGGETWFRLGDRDLALHLRRSELLARGESLTEITRQLSRQLGVEALVLPMSDEPVRTMVETPEGMLPFQDYFVRRRQQDEVLALRFAGIESARPTPEVEEALARCRAVVLCPSNPFVSLAPILELPGLRRRLRELAVPKVAVSPIVGGKAVKGPAGAMMASLGHEVSPVGIAALYSDIVDTLVLDEVDAELAPRVREQGLRAVVAQTVMRTPEDRLALAKTILAEGLAAG